jgi:hypothetical protein
LESLDRESNRSRLVTYYTLSGAVTQMQVPSFLNLSFPIDFDRIMRPWAASPAKLAYMVRSISLVQLISEQPTIAVRKDHPLSA